MIHTITARNVNKAFSDAIWWIRSAGQPEQSRNGPVLVAPGPVITTYTSPCERVLFNPVRDANPVFHLMEAIWMLAGQNRVNFLLPFNARFSGYAEPNGTVHGAYGYRWRKLYAMDQIFGVIEVLKKDPTSRQAVIGMWDPDVDLGQDQYRDRPCNSHIYFDCRYGVLNMTVCCRSNDLLWGAYGANVVHMSMLQEVIASGVGVPVGVYRQFSNNFHIYTELDQTKHLLMNPPVYEYDLYESQVTDFYPLIAHDENFTVFLDDCEALVAGRDEFSTKFITHIAKPLHDAYLRRKSGADWSIADIPNCDWKLAFTQWIERRT